MAKTNRIGKDTDMDKKYAFGVDIGGTTVKIGLFTTAGKLEEMWEIPTNKADEGRHILEEIAVSISEKLTEYKSTLEEVQGIGMGIPGPILQDGTVNRCVNLGWGVFNVQNTMSNLCGGVPVRCGNDANVAALGEMWQGGGRGHRNVVMVTLGTGVGGGVIVDEQIISGAFGAGGEIGHIMVRKDEPDVWSSMLWQQVLCVWQNRDWMRMLPGRSYGILRNLPVRQFLMLRKPETRLH